MMLTISEIRWHCVPQRASELAEECRDVAEKVQEAIQDLPRDGFLDLWYNSHENKLLLNTGDWMEQKDLDRWLKVLKPLVDKVDHDSEIGKPGDSDGAGRWVKIAQRPWVAIALEKGAASRTLDAGMRLMGFKPGLIPTAPNPLASGLASGLLGAGIGYGAGYLGEQIMPQRWEKGRLRRSLALLGGLGGAGLGGMYAGANAVAGHPVLSQGVMEGSGPYDTARSHQPYLDGFGTPNPAYSGHLSIHGMPELEEFYQQAGLDKKAFQSMTGYNAPWPEIDVPAFHATVNFDPRVRNRLDPNMRAAASGLMQGASNLAGGARLVSPLDVARMAAGMGSGYVSGALVGRALGTLMGAPPTVQERLKTTGLWAGAVANLVPMVF